LQQCLVPFYPINLIVGYMNQNSRPCFYRKDIDTFSLLKKFISSPDIRPSFSSLKLNRTQREREKKNTIVTRFFSFSHSVLFVYIYHHSSPYLFIVNLPLYWCRYIFLILLHISPDGARQCPLNSSNLLFVVLFKYQQRGEM
jgi:hypothetical protein